jgi:hypothetical protein
MATLPTPSLRTAAPPMPNPAVLPNRSARLDRLKAQPASPAKPPSSSTTPTSRTRP